MKQSLRCQISKMLIEVDREMANIQYTLHTIKNMIIAGGLHGDKTTKAELLALIANAEKSLSKVRD